MADVIDAEAIREPSQPPGASVRIKVVFDLPVCPSDGRHGLALNSSLVHLPPQPTADEEHEDDQSPNAEPEPAPSGFRTK